MDLIPSYKAHRVAEAAADGVDVEETPPGLVAQIPLIREVLAALDVTIVGAARHEADDVIGSLTAQADMPVDIVTGDRDLFQLIDDERGVRVINTARGMSRLEVLTDVTVVGKYGVLPSQYADYAALRGDTSDGLPGVTGVGEKTAASLLKEFVDLDGVVSAAADSNSAMSARVRANLTAAAEYLAVAPTVIEVVKDLDLGAFDARISPLDAGHLGGVRRLASDWNLGGSAQRVLSALGNKPEAG